MNIFSCSLLFWFTTFIVILTGNYKEYILFMSIIIVHELGHYLMAYILKWKIKKIVLYPFGAITYFEDKVNKPMQEELLILISGPIIQIIYFQLFKMFFPEIFSFYNEILLLFNLLPIYPLDGGKIFNLFYQTIFPYLKSHKVMVISSIIFIFIFCIYFNLYQFSIIIILYFILLFIKVIKEKRLESLLFNKFLLERVLYNFNYPIKKIKSDNINKMYRNYNHKFLINNKWIKEKDFLRKKFDL